jgi:hypothetical protein
MVMGTRLALAVATAVACGAGCAAPPPVPVPPPVHGVPVPAVPVPVAAPACPTIFDFLGVEALHVKVTPLLKDKCALLGQAFPFLQTHALLKPVMDPANLASASPAIAGAAAVAAAEAAAPQKIAAVKYLAKVGCGCYPEVEQAFLAALEDCTEEVRFEAAQAVRYAADNPCRPCCLDGCCTPAIREVLYKIAYGYTERCCPFEPSPRVRRAARLALGACGPGPLVGLEDPGLPLEGPPDELLPPALPVGGLEDGPAAPPDPSAPTAPELAFHSADDIETAHTRSAEPSSVAAPASSSKVIPAAATDAEPARSKPAVSAVAVRWEQVSVSLDQFDDPEQAVIALNAIRRRLEGDDIPPPPALDPSKRVVTATHEWTWLTEVPSPHLARQLARLPVGRISRVIQADGSVHLLRVLERRSMPLDGMVVE